MSSEGGRKGGVGSKVAAGFTKTAKTITRPVEKAVEKTVGGILHRGGESKTASGSFPHGGDSDADGAKVNPPSILKRMENVVTSAAEAVTAPVINVLHLKKSKTAPDEENKDAPTVPPDSILKTMKMIANKRVQGVSVQDFYETVFSEGNNTEKDPFYGPWLTGAGKEDVQVGDWVTDGEFVGSWCGETYTQKRTVTFVFNKNIPLWGPTVAAVTHTHHCRVSEDKCVLQMTIAMANIPYSDCFQVEIRWVVTAMGEKELVVQIGLFVNFVKSCM